MSATAIEAAARAILGVELGGLAERGQRLFGPAEGEQRRTAAVVGDGARRTGRDRLVGSGERLRRVDPGQDAREDRERRRRRLRLDRLLGVHQGVLGRGRTQLVVRERRETLRSPHAGATGRGRVRGARVVEVADLLLQPTEQQVAFSAIAALRDRLLHRLHGFFGLALQGLLGRLGEGLIELHVAEGGHGEKCGDGDCGKHGLHEASDPLLLSLGVRRNP